MGDMSPAPGVLPAHWHSQPLASKKLWQGWEFRQLENTKQTATSGRDASSADGGRSERLTSTWHPVRKVPSTVHQDLIDNNLLDDPFIGFNERKAEWVGERDWVYRTKFTLPRQIPESRFRSDEPGRTTTKAVLAFDGLDTFATVKVNGKVVLKADNMFRPWRVDVTDLVVTEGSDDEQITVVSESNALGEHNEYGGRTPTKAREHTLEVVFESALLKAREIKENHPDHKWVCWNGDAARLAARKAQYHWGWDWGPFLMCAGIWKDVRIEVYEARITDVRLDVLFGLSLDDVTVKVSFDTEGWDDSPAHEIGKENIQSSLCASLEISKLGRQPEETVNIHQCFITGQKEMQVALANPDLWWPCGYGGQTIYEFEVAIYSSNNTLLHTMIKKTGLRKLELIRDDDTFGDDEKSGQSFNFRVNNTDIFCGGSCWIPADSFLTNLTPNRYKRWIQLMAVGNQKMVRVWGGGIYEDDAFYDACDEAGILVWQDFMFACGNYPTFPSMLASIDSEAIANVRRIRNHPSLALFAGNNEDYSLQESEGLTYDYADKDESNWLRTDFPARYIYESLLPAVVAAESPAIPYHPGSPWGNGKPTSDLTVGDIHQWNVWHGTQEKYQVYASLGGRFNSEFGMEAFPHIGTIKSFATDKEDLYPQSHLLDCHNKATGHERRIATYMVENVRTVTDLEGYIYLTQLIQSEAMTYAFRGWRRMWGNGRDCGGALVWQLNDCWPVTSWAICDYYLRPKPAYYAISRALAPIAIGICREHHDWSVSHAREPDNQSWDVWVLNSSSDIIDATVEVHFISVQTGKPIKHPMVTGHVTVHPNESVEVGGGVIDNLTEEPHVLAAHILVDEEIVARDVDWPQPLKYLHFPARKPIVRYEGDRLHVTVDRPIKCLVFEERDGIQLNGNALDIVPNDEHVIIAKGFSPGDEPLEFTYLGAGEQ